MATQIEKKQISPAGQNRGNDVVAIVILAFAVLVFLCLVTSNPNDWNLNTASSQKTQNWIGIVGSVIADLLFQFIGLMSYFIPVLLALVAWRIFQSKSLNPSISKLLGFLLFIISGASLVSLIGWRGGMVGAFLIQNLTWLLGTIGSAILLTAVCFASLLVITNLSFAFLSTLR